MADFSTYEALSALCNSIPEWNERLDKLNGQIALRQIELARLTEGERSSTRSLKNKGSTESLRPNDGGENPFLSQESDNPEDIQMNPFDTPNSNTSPRRPNSSTAAARAAAAFITPPKESSHKGPAIGAMMRQSSYPTHTKAAGAAARKRKTESIASGESIAPKYRTRSMIIVYYDSTVQQAFEDVVKFVSSSRNAMRKGKMNSKMAEIKRAAELELEDDDDNEDEAEDNNGNFMAVDEKVIGSRPVESAPAGGMVTGDTNGKNEVDPSIPRLRFLSTRKMGLSRGDSREGNGSTLSVGMLRGYRRSGGATSDIFDVIDKGLEWVQSQCEHAAHQFLRDGDCSTEISNIKRRLAEVRETAGKEVEKLKAKGADHAPPLEEARSLQMKTLQEKREFGAPKDLEIDIDDEGVDDLEPPKLIFKRSRDIGL